MLSAFEIIGPPMIGPSSSHTAGACRIGLIARALLGEPPAQATIGLHGSFAATGQGHATDRALVAGLLGFAPDDERLKEALALAPAQHLKVEFGVVDLGDQVHPNTAQLELRGQQSVAAVVASSIGGGSIVVTQIDGHSVELRGTLESLVLWHADTPGFLARVTAVCACVGLNIAAVRTSRRERGEEALTTVEVDGVIMPDVLSVLSRSQGVRRLVHLARLPGI